MARRDPQLPIDIGAKRPIDGALAVHVGRMEYTSKPESFVILDVDGSRIHRKIVAPVSAEEAVEAIGSREFAVLDSRSHPRDKRIDWFRRSALRDLRPDYDGGTLIKLSCDMPYEMQSWHRQDGFHARGINLETARELFGT